MAGDTAKEGTAFAAQSQTWAGEQAETLVYGPSAFYRNSHPRSVTPHKPENSYFMALQMSPGDFLPILGLRSHTETRPCITDLLRDPGK